MLTNKKQVLWAVSLFGVALWSNSGGGDGHFLRRLAVECIHNVYATEETVKKIPPVPASENHELPAYISLCQEWIRHDAYYNETNPHDHYKVVEAEDVCADWSAAHYNIMDIHAALIVTNQIKRIKYRHNCDRTRVTDEATLGFDHTTIQQVLNTPSLATNREIFSAEEIKQQCRRCLLRHDPAVENVRVKSKAVHHCLAWPEDKTRVLDANALPVVPSKTTGVTAFSSMVGPFRNRMYLAALEWQNVTDKPPAEEKDGLVIWLDPTSIGLAYADVASEIDPLVTSISILSGPTCATAIFPTGQVCHEYGKGLRDHLLSAFPNLGTNGWNGGAGVTFKITASTAAGFSRMVLSNQLLCPPRTASCYTPAMSKMMNHQSAKLLEDPKWMKAVDFFTIAGTHGVVSVKVLEESKIPNTYTADPHNRHLEDTPEQFSHVNTMVDDEGYPEQITKVPPASDEDIAKLTDQQILDDIALALGRFLDNPNVNRGKLEIIPTLEMIQEAIEKGEALNVNDVEEDMKPPKDGNGNGARSGSDSYRHGELASDADSGRTNQSPLGIEFWESSAAQRHDSLLRIQSEWESAFYGHIQNHRNGEDPSTIYEIPCPEHTANGGTVTYLDGTATTTTPTAVVIASQDGVVIRDPETGETTATGIENVPTGTAFTQGGGYKIKEDGDKTNKARRLIIEATSIPYLPFTEELIRVCKDFHKRKLAKKRAAAA